MNSHLSSTNDVHRSVIHALQHHALIQPDAPAFIFVKNKSLQDQTVSYAFLMQRVASVARALKEHGCERNERVLLLYQSGLDYVEACLGCLMAGAIAVPVYPPANKRHVPRILSILKDSRPRVILSTQSECSRMSAFADQEAGWQGNIRIVCTDIIETDATDEYAFNDEDLAEIALLQYTSGSTGAPKGVMITHTNLNANQKAISHAFQGEEPGCGLGWLPLYHDMGLIGCIIQSIYWGHPYVFMSPFTFLQHPATWLKAIHKYRAVRSGGPNFAYDLCASKLSEEQLEGLDLSSWKVAFCGSEPIRPSSLTSFAKRFERYGFNARSFLPCYGLAEATLFVSGSQGDDGINTLSLDSAALNEGKIEVACEGGTKVTAVVASGKVADDIDLRIVDPETLKQCAPGRVGEIWVNGPAVAAGYWGQEEATSAVFNAHIAGDPCAKPYMRTGDLGFCRDGALFVTGRRKELIIIGGKNYFPHDLETIAESATSAIRRAHSAAVAIENGAMEGLGLVCEIERTARGKADFDIDAKSVVAAISQEFGIAPIAICFVRPGSMPKTSSGKIQRTEIRRRLMDGSLEELYRWPQPAQIAQPADEPALAEAA